MTRDSSAMDKSQMMKQDGQVNGVIITSNKNNDLNNNSESSQGDNTKTRALCDRQGFFQGKDGAQYRFDKNHNLLNKKNEPQALKRVPVLI